MTLLVVEDGLMAHLALALDRYSRELRRAGGRAPLEVEQFRATICDRLRQEATSLARVDEWLDGAAMQPALLTRAETARLLAVSERSVDRLVATGALRPVRLLGSSRFRVQDVSKFVDTLGETG